MYTSHRFLRWRDMKGKCVMKKLGGKGCGGGSSRKNDSESDAVGAVVTRMHAAVAGAARMRSFLHHTFGLWKNSPNPKPQVKIVSNRNFCQSFITTFN